MQPDDFLYMGECIREHMLKNTGTCRVNPPTRERISHFDGYPVSNLYMSAWPQVESSSTCGKWEQR